MSKTTFIFLAIMCAVFAVFIAIVALSPSDTGDDPQPAIPPGTDNTVVGEQQVTPVAEDWRTRTYIPFKERGSNETLDVVNFLSDTEIEQYDPTTFLIAEDISGETGLFRVFYMGDEGAIVVSLLTSDVAFARNLAEKELKTVLGLEEWELCRLEIRVTTPRDVSEEYSGRDLGLSFCPFSNPLN